jgi:hypothetical protein
MLFGAIRIIAARSAEFWANFIGVLALAVGIAVLCLTVIQFRKTKADEAQRERQQKEMDKRLQRITDLMSRGQDILHTPPEHRSTPATVNRWIQSAEAWIAETNGFLKSCSEHASLAFMDDVGTWAWTTVVTPAISQGVHQEYRILNQRLKNLRSILDNQDVYLRPV